MKIFGIDPGSRKLGWSIIEVQGKKITYIASGVLRFEKIEEFLDRLSYIHQAIKELVEIHTPTHVALESLIYVKSVTSLAKLAQARGAAIAGFDNSFKGKIFEYSPNLVKSTVVGHGHASKEGVEKVLRMMFGNINFKTDDESDALAIAVCHALSFNVNVKNKLSDLELKGQKFTKPRSLKSVFKKRA